MYKVERLEPVTMRYDLDSLGIQKLEECADHLVTVCQHADYKNNFKDKETKIKLN